MAQHLFDREELYAMVWAEPMRTLAARLGVSDVGLAKACRRAMVPVPERGYWAKLQHGKATTKPPLSRSAKAPKQVLVSPPRPKPKPSPAAKAVLEQAVARPPVPVPPDLRRPHALVRHWIDEDQRLRRQYKREGWGIFGLTDLSGDLQQRRLRLYNALFIALESRSFAVTGERNPDVGAVAKKAGEAIEFRIYERQRKTRRPITEEERRWEENRGKTDKATFVAAGDLVLKIKTYARGATPEDFRDATAPLEDQLAQAITGFEAAVVELQAWRAEREAAAERARQAEARRLRREERQRLEAARRERLLATAAAWRQAQDIRAFVAAAERLPAAGREGFAAWRDWALSQAEALDPLVGDDLNLSVLPPFDEA